MGELLVEEEAGHDHDEAGTRVQESTGDGQGAFGHADEITNIEEGNTADTHAQEKKNILLTDF